MGGSATCGVFGRALISPTQIWQAGREWGQADREGDLMNAMRFMHYSNAWTVRSACGHWIMSHPLRRMEVRLGGWLLAIRERGTVAAIDICTNWRCATADAVDASWEGARDATSLISKCESHTHTRTHSHTLSESVGANKRNIFLAKRRRWRRRRHRRLPNAQNALQLPLARLL